MPSRPLELRRLVLLVGLFLALVAVYVTTYPLPEEGQTQRPSYLEQYWLRSAGIPPDPELDVVFVPTPQVVVDRMLELAELKTNDVVYDLGCGDGRFVVTAARRHGVRAVGIDLNPQRIIDSMRNVRTNDVGHLVTVRQADIFEIDFSEATVVTLYLLPELNVRLKPKLAKLRPGTRILSHQFDMAGAKPLLTETFRLGEPEHRSYIYKWVVPWEETDTTR